MTIRRLLVTGGAGFIGANFVLRTLRQEKALERLVNLDLLTYAGHRISLREADADPRHVFVHGDIGSRELIRSLLEQYQPDAIVNFAAESHVDRSIAEPDAFVNTNVTGTFRLLDEVRQWWQRLDDSCKEAFRFVHVSTDEVYGSLPPDVPPATEGTPYDPSSPYAASKAASDHFARACHRTYGLPVLVTNCSNNYGPFQYPEKLIPLMIVRALRGDSLPVYGDGRNVRDWLFVADHCDAITRVLERGRPGATYNIGGEGGCENIDLVRRLCRMLDELKPRADQKSYSEQICFVADRPGHDRRYAIDSSKIRRELEWSPAHTLDTGLLETVRWYLSNMDWVAAVTQRGYSAWIERNYGQRR